MQILRNINTNFVICCLKMKKVLIWYECLRAYALPMSIMAWLIPFCAGVFDGGNKAYGILALLGIIFAHLGANLFDDVIDYKKFLKNKEENSALNLKKGKCKFFFDGTLTVKKGALIAFSLFFCACLIGLFFVYLYKFPVIILMTVTGILCLFYPKSGYYGLSEIIIGTIYAPLLFTGVYYVMTGAFSQKLEWISLAFALVTLTLLYTDFFLDYTSDKEGGKRTLPILSGSKINAYYFYIFIIFLIYAIIFLGIHAQVLSMKTLIIFLSMFQALKTVENLQNYIETDIKDEAAFLKTMNDVQKFIAIFTILCVSSIVI